MNICFDQPFLLYGKACVSEDTKSHTEAMTCVLQIITYSLAGSTKENKINFDGTMMQTLQLQQLTKKHVTG